MSTKQFFTKGWPTRLAFQVAHYAPAPLGHAIVSFLARLATWVKPDMYCAARDNLRHVLGEGVSPRQLNHAAYRLFCNAARSYYELFRNVSHGRVRVENFKPPVRMTAETRAHIDQALESGRGLLLLGCHMSNFDLAGVGLSQYLPCPVQALSIANPDPSFEFFNRMRAIGQGFITPVSPASLRQAMRRLQDGGIVITGVDRPLEEGRGENVPLTFFGETAQLPGGYIRIPLITDCLVMTISFIYEDGVYWIVGNPPFEMERTGDQQRDIEVNRRRVLAQIEEFIREDPTQWMMFVRVWPNTEEET